MWVHTDTVGKSDVPYLGASSSHPQHCSVVCYGISFGCIHTLRPQRFPSKVRGGEGHQILEGKGEKTEFSVMTENSPKILGK